MSDPRQADSRTPQFHPVHALTEDERAQLPALPSHLIATLGMSVTARLTPRGMEHTVALTLANRYTDALGIGVADTEYEALTLAFTRASAKLLRMMQSAPAGRR